jgi:ElaB/YqjD/DUF883 family membrane-anchored ribosome-binding protein
MKSFQRRGARIASKAKERVKEKLSDQKKKASESLEGVAQVIRESAEKVQDRGQAFRIAQESARKLEELSSFLRKKEMEEILSEAERFIKKQPWIFLGGSFALGFLVARFLKSSESGLEVTEEPAFGAEGVPEGVTTH